MLSTTSVLAQMAGRGGARMDWGGSGPSWGMVVVMIVLAVLAVGAVVWVVVYASRSGRHATTVVTAPAAARRHRRDRPGDGSRWHPGLTEPTGDPRPALRQG